MKRKKMYYFNKWKTLLTMILSCNRVDRKKLEFTIYELSNLFEFILLFLIIS